MKSKTAVNFDSRFAFRKGLTGNGLKGDFCIYGLHLSITVVKGKVFYDNNPVADSNAAGRLTGTGVFFVT